PALVRSRVPGMHTPSPVQVAPVAGVRLDSEVYRPVSVPPTPIGTVPVVPGTHTPSPVHSPYSHSLAMVQKRSRVPHIPQGSESSVAPGVGQRSAAQARVTSYVHASLQSSSRIWSAGQPSSVVRVAPGAHSPSPSQEPTRSHSQAVVQRRICEPQFPQAIVSTEPGTHAPWPVHSPYDQVPVDWQKRSTVPHIPQGTCSMAPGGLQGSGPASSGPASGGGPASSGALPPSSSSDPASRAPPSRAPPSTVAASIPSEPASSVRGPSQATATSKDSTNANRSTASRSSITALHSLTRGPLYA